MSESARATPTLFQSWWAVAILFVAGTLANIDRTILSLLVAPLKRDLLLTDTEIGLLSGLAFAVFYSFMAVPVGWLADRGSRRGLIAIGIAVWSAATALCGAAQSFLHLFLARMGVGLGEAVLMPAGYSLISDIFPKEKRGFPLAVFSASVAWGTALALIAGGALVQWADHFGTVSTWFGHLRSWQLVFAVVGLPGLAVAVIAMTMTEPRLRVKEKVPELAPGELMKFLKRNLALLSLTFFAFCFGGLIGSGSSAWSPTYYMRVFHLTPAQIGVALGTAVLCFAPIGSWLGGLLLNRWTRKGYHDAPLRMGLLAMSGFTTAHFLAPLMPNWWLALFFQTLGFVFGTIQFIAGASSVQFVTPPRLRARVTAIYFLIVTIVANGGGPAVVALFTDYLFRNDNDVGYSMALTTAIFGPAMILFVALARKSYARAVERLG